MQASMVKKRSHSYPKKWRRENSGSEEHEGFSGTGIIPFLDPRSGYKRVYSIMCLRAIK